MEHHHEHDHSSHDSSKHTGHGGHHHAEHDHHSHHAHMVADFRKRFWISLILTLPILSLSPLIRSLLGLEKVISFPGDIWLLFGLATIIFVYGGYPFLKGFWDEVKSGKPGMMTLIALAISVAYIYSSAVVFGLSGKMFFWELASLIDIMLLGHWIEMKSVMGASRALEELARLMPSEAHKVLADGSTVDVSINELQHGDIILVKPGEKVPADGIVVEGESSVNESMLTGESKPVFKQQNDTIIGGSINAEGALQARIEKTGEDSFLAQVINLVREAQESKSRTQDLANRAALWLTIVAIVGGALTFFVWLYIVEKDLAFALERTVSVMVITCPHALGLAVPLVVAVSTALSAKHGLLIRDRAAFEASRNIQAIVFDKTGTLTKGEFGVTDIIVLDSAMDKEALLEVAAAVEAHSEHPIAKGIVAEVDTPPTVQHFKAIPGKGAQGIVNGQSVKIVSPGYLTDQGKKFDSEEIDKALERGQTVVFVLVDDALKGAIALADIVRDDSRQAIRQLQEKGIRAMMLTGDNRHVAEQVSEELRLDDFFAEVLPDEKAAKIKEVQSRGPGNSYGWRRSE